jgi:hypothetical protein
MGDAYDGMVSLVPVDHDPFAVPKPGQTVPPTPDPMMSSRAAAGEVLQTARPYWMDLDPSEREILERSDAMQRGISQPGKVLPTTGMNPVPFAALDIGSMLPVGGAAKLAAGALGVGARRAAKAATEGVAEHAAPFVSRGAALVTPEGLAIKSPAYLKEAKAALEEVERQGRGAGPLDLTGQSEIPNVPQVAIPRRDPPRGVSQRMQDALNMPAVQRGVDESITTGMGLGSGMEKWYHTQPIRSAWLDELGARKGEPAFSGYMGQTSGTSPRSDVPANIRNASYYYQRWLAGEPLPDPVPYPYGHLAQGLHRQNFEALSSGGWDVLKNPKPPSYRANLEGNLIPVAADAHAFKNIGMRTGDPRFLETSTRDVVKPGASPSEFQREYGDIKVDDRGRTIVTFRPQQLVESGRMSMKQAKGDPALWAAVPNDNEYGAVEDFWSRLARARGLQPAQGQSAGWAGGGELTGLGTSPTHTFPEMFNERTLFTSLMRNEKPESTLRHLIRGRKPLLAVPPAAFLGAEAAREQQYPLPFQPEM